MATEIVAVDSGSTDGTIELLESHTARIIRSEWLGHIRTKQLALESCTGDWVLSLDSDESLEPGLRESLSAAFARAAPTDRGFEINRRTYYKDHPLRHAWQPEWRLRLVRRGQARWGGHDPHDVLSLTDPAARPSRLSGHLRHDSFSTFTEHLRKQWDHATTMARSLHAAGKRGSLLRLAVSPPGAFLKQLLIKRAFLDGYPGWLAAASTACAALIKHAALVELSRQSREVAPAPSPRDNIPAEPATSHEPARR